MVHSHGLRSGTRHLFAKPFRRHGMPPVSTVLSVYKIGDYVDVVADSAVRKGMPHKYYHGRTGIVWNVTPRGVGVIINKVVRQRTLRKRICVRYEHVRKSRCREGFLEKQRAYRAYKQEVKKAAQEGKKLTPKRVSNRGGKVVKAKVENLGRTKADFDAMNKY